MSVKYGEGLEDDFSGWLIKLEQLRQISKTAYDYCHEDNEFFRFIGKVWKNNNKLVNKELFL